MHREVGGGQSPRQPGQVRKEAAVTSARPGSPSGLPPAAGPAGDPAVRRHRPMLDSCPTSVTPSGQTMSDPGHPLSRSRPQVPAAKFCRDHRAGCDGPHPVECDCLRADRAGVHAHRGARDRQDDNGPDHCPRPQLRRSGRCRGSDDFALRRLRSLPRDRRGPACRRDRDGRRLAYRGRQDARAVGRRALSPGLGAVQDLHHRRSSHALRAFVQCPAEDARRTAARRQIHLRDDRDPQGAADRAVALPALLAAARAGRAAGRALSPDRRSRRRLRSRLRRSA